MQDQIKLATVGTGVVGHVTLYARVKRGDQIVGFDVNPTAIPKLHNSGVNACKLGECHGCDST